MSYCGFLLKVRVCLTLFGPRCARIMAKWVSPNGETTVKSLNPACVRDFLILTSAGKHRGMGVEVKEAFSSWPPSFLLIRQDSLVVVQLLQLLWSVFTRDGFLPLTSSPTRASQSSVLTNWPWLTTKYEIM